MERPDIDAIEKRATLVPAWRVQDIPQLIAYIRELEQPRMNGLEISDLIHASEIADWTQVVLNGGPPCFHVEDGRFCLRAERWVGHHSSGFHSYVSLEELITKLTEIAAPRVKV